MLVEQLMIRPVYHCRPEDTLAQGVRHEITEIEIGKTLAAICERPRRELAA